MQIWIRLKTLTKTLQIGFLPSYPSVSQQRSAFVMVHFCISEHRSLAAWSNSPDLSVKQFLTTAQQQLCLISTAFLNLGCQGSLVGGCLLFKKSDSPLHTMTNPKTEEKECCQCKMLKLKYHFCNEILADTFWIAASEKAIPSPSV